MDWQSGALVALIAIFAGFQYVMAWSAIRDLLSRPRVRGNSRTLWALLILCAPIIGALAYGSVGPTSFRQSERKAGPSMDPLLMWSEQQSESRPTNVTTLRPRSANSMSDRLGDHRPGVTRSRAHNTGAVSAIRREGA